MTLYRHFPSKEALFEGLVMRMCEHMRGQLENAPSSDTRGSATTRLATAMSTFAAGLIAPDWLALYRLVVADGWRFPELARAFDRSGMRVIRRRVAEVLETGGVSAGRSTQVAPEVVALALGDAYQRAILGIAEEGDSAAFAQQIEAAVAHGFRRNGGS